MKQEQNRLLKRALELGVSEGQRSMARILLAVNGYKNALEFVNGLEERGLLPRQRGYVQLKLL